MGLGLRTLRTCLEGGQETRGQGNKGWTRALPAPHGSWPRTYFRGVFWGPPHPQPWAVPPYPPSEEMLNL